MNYAAIIMGFALTIPSIALAQDADVASSSASSLFSSAHLDVGTSAALQYESVRWSGAGVELEEQRALWQSRLDAGFGYEIGRLLESDLEGTSYLGVGVTFFDGHVPVVLGQRGGLSWSFGPGFRAGVALDVALQLNTSQFDQSAAMFGTEFVFGWRGIELAYSPAVLVAIGSEEESTFGGERVRALSTGSIAHTFSFRTRWELWD